MKSISITIESIPVRARSRRLGRMHRVLWRRKRMCWFQPLIWIAETPRTVVDDPPLTDDEKEAISQSAEEIRQQIDAEVIRILLNRTSGDVKAIKILSGIEEVLQKPLIHDVILVGLTDEQGIKEMKAEGFVPLGWTDEELHYGSTEEDRQAGGSEDETKG